MARVGRVSIEAALAARSHAIALSPESECTGHMGSMQPPTLALAFLQFVQALGVTESGAFRLLPVLFPPLVAGLV